MKKIETLDGLRGFAVLMVVIHHIPPIDGGIFWKAVNAIPVYLKVGYFGVDIFFVLSGFLITRILIKDKQREDFSFKRFYLKRALRIFPIYFLTLLAVGFLFSWDGMLPVAMYYSNYYFATNFAPNAMRHTWSLAVEEHFYLIWPLLIYLLPLSKAKKVILYGFPAFAILAAIVTSIAYDRGQADALMYMGTAYRILTLSLGASFAFIEKGLIGRSNRVILRLCGAAVSVFAISVLLDNYGLFRTLPEQLKNLVFLTPVSCLIFLIAIGVEGKRNAINWLLTNRPVKFVGKISYGIYLYHYPIIFVFLMTGHPQAVAPHELILPLLLSFVAAVASYYLVEKRLLKLKDNLGGQSGVSYGNLAVETAGR